MEIFNSASFSQSLIRLMASHGWTQKELASESGLSQPSISRYLKGTTEPKVSDLIALARSFHVSLDDLTGHSTQAVDLNVSEQSARYDVVQPWRDRALAAEAKVQQLKSGLEGLLKKI